MKVKYNAQDYQHEFKPCADFVSLGVIGKDSRALNSILPREAAMLARLGIVILSVRPSVCLSVTHVVFVEMKETTKL